MLMYTGHLAPRLRGLMALVAVIAATFITVIAVAPAHAATGSANAFCTYNGTTWQVVWNGSAAGWQRGNLHWDLWLVSPYGTTVGSDSGNWANSTGGTTPTHYYPSVNANYNTHMSVSGPGGSASDVQTC
jgi:hypothetical protein